MFKKIAVILVSILITVAFWGCSTSPQVSSQASRPGSQKTTDTNTEQSPVNNQAGRIVTTVTRVVDGDTIVVEINGNAEKVRLIGVDTPETVHPALGEEPYGKEASNFTKQQLTGKTVELEMDVQERDQYDRLLAYVWIDEQMFNEVLLSGGYAQVATFPPNVKYVDRFTAAQKAARESNLGLWSLIQEEKISGSEEQGQYVGSIKSNKYHSPDCEWAQQIKPANQIWFTSRQEAEE